MSAEAAFASRFIYLRTRKLRSPRIAKLQPGSGELGAFQTLGGEEWDKWPVGWTRDSRSVIFLSNPRGNLGIFQQDLRTHVTQPLLSVSPPGHVGNPVLTPDGRSLLFTQTDSVDSSASSVRIMRMPIGGGPATLVAKGSYSYDCSPRANVCVLSDIENERRVFALLNPLKGRGPDIAHASSTSAEIWRLSPDGKIIALPLGSEQSKLQFIPLDGSPSYGIDINSAEIQKIAWSSDNQHIYVSGRLGATWAILRVGLDGKFKKLSEVTEGQWLGLDGPSPDEHYLAYTFISWEANAVMLENF